MQVLNRSEMKKMKGGTDCGCYGTYDLYRQECLQVYGSTSDGMACVQETNSLQAQCIEYCNYLVFE